MCRGVCAGGVCLEVCVCVCEVSECLGGCLCMGVYEKRVYVQGMHV